MRGVLEAYLYQSGFLVSTLPSEASPWSIRDQQQSVHGTGASTDEVPTAIQAVSTALVLAALLDLILLISFSACRCSGPAHPSSVRARYVYSTHDYL